AGHALLNPWVRTEDGAARATIKHYYWARLMERAFWAKVLGGRFDVRAAASSFAALARQAFGGRQEVAAARSLPERLHAALNKFRGGVLIMLSGADLTAQEFADLSASPEWSRLLKQAR